MPARAVVAGENNACARIDGEAVILIFDRAVLPRESSGRAEKEQKEKETYQSVIVSGAWFPTSNPSVFAPAGLPPLIEFAWSPRAIAHQCQRRPRDMGERRKQGRQCSQSSTVTAEMVKGAELSILNTCAGELRIIRFYINQTPRQTVNEPEMNRGSYRERPRRLDPTKTSL